MIIGCVRASCGQGNRASIHRQANVDTANPTQTWQVAIIADLANTKISCCDGSRLIGASSQQRKFLVVHAVLTRHYCYASCAEISLA